MCELYLALKRDHFKDDLYHRYYKIKVLDFEREIAVISGWGRDRWLISSHEIGMFSTNPRGWMKCSK